MPLEGSRNGPKSCQKSAGRCNCCCKRAHFTQLRPTASSTLAHSLHSLLRKVQGSSSQGTRPYPGGGGEGGGGVQGAAGRPGEPLSRLQAFSPSTKCSKCSAAVAAGENASSLFLVLGRRCLHPFRDNIKCVATRCTLGTTQGLCELAALSFSTSVRTSSSSTASSSGGFNEYVKSCATYW